MDLENFSIARFGSLLMKTVVLLGQLDLIAQERSEHALPIMVGVWSG